MQGAPPAPPKEGQRAVNRQTGETAVFTQGQWVKQSGQGMQADASQRGRLSLGLGPMVQAEQTLSASERDGNPLQKDWGAAMLQGASEAQIGGWRPLEIAGEAAKMIGGQDYQTYLQAAKAFESQLMPIMSGAAVSPSEAQRQIRAALPELGDSPETLRAKAAMRQQMLNGAARTMNAQLPYPDRPTYGVNTMEVPQGAGQPQQGGQPVRVRSVEEARQLRPGTVFITPDGRQKVR